MGCEVMDGAWIREIEGKWNICVCACACMRVCVCACVGACVKLEN